MFVNKFIGNKEPLKVTIYNSDDDVVVENNLAADVQGKIYKFKEEGEYTIVLSSNAKNYAHTVSINK